MLVRILLLIYLFVAQVGYSKTHSEHAMRQHTIKTCPIANFTAVQVNGNMDINLHTGYRKPAVTILADPKDLANIKVRVIDGVLYLSLKNPSIHYGPISADIRSQYLNGLVYHGNGRITGHHLRANLENVLIDNDGETSLRGTILLNNMELLGKGYTQMSGVLSHHLHVKMSQEAKLRLTGIAALQHLEMKDKTWFSLSWVKTPSLILCASDKSYIELAGIANKLDAQLWNYSQLNARYLRARRAFVKTHNHSIAKISATQHQHTLAKDASDIEFYNLPDMKTDFMALDGSVLDMRAFNTPFVEEPTAYNK
jgi:hypothetical protein